MNIRQLQLHNIANFRGDHTIDFTIPQSQGRKNVILLGGLNGAGKTTILDAIKLCLYGYQALGERGHTAKYRKYVESKLNRIEKADKNKICSVSVTFDYYHEGRSAIFTVLRRWKWEPDFQEDLCLWRDKEEIHPITETIWTDMMQAIVPLGASQFFFFDGEKIADLADDENNNYQLVQSIRSLLNFQLLSQLEGDLTAFQRDANKRLKGNAVAIEYQQSQEDLVNCEAKERALIEAQHQAKSEKDAKEGHLNQARAEFLAMGGEYAANYERLTAQRLKLERERDALNSEITELCSGLLPYRRILPLLQRLKTQLAKEEELKQYNMAKAWADERFGGLLEDLPSGQQKDLQARWSKNTALPMDLVDAGIKHDLPMDKVHLIFRQIHEVEALDKNSLAKINARKERIAKKLGEINAVLRMKPNQHQIERKQREIMELEHEIKVLGDEIEQKEREITHVESEISVKKQVAKNREGRYQESVRSQQRLKLALKTKAALREFSERLVVTKIEQLETYFMEMYNQLARKKELIRSIRIDPKTFGVTLTHHSGLPVPRVELSAGEKQIYAISMIWALCRASGKSLPVIIDTPMGRLDSLHKKNILERYYANASHQVVLLSTDTEVDKRYYQYVKDVVGKKMTVSFDEEEQSAVVSDGYFSLE